MTESLNIKFSVLAPDKLKTVPPGALNVNPLILPPVVPVKIVPPALDNMSSFVSRPKMYALFNSMGNAKATAPFTSYKVLESNKYLAPRPATSSSAKSAVDLIIL